MSEHVQLPNSRHAPSASCVPGAGPAAGEQEWATSSPSAQGAPSGQGRQTHKQTAIIQGSERYGRFPRETDVEVESCTMNKH